MKLETGQTVCRFFLAWLVSQTHILYTQNIESGEVSLRSFFPEGGFKQCLLATIGYLYSQSEAPSLLRHPSDKKEVAC